MEGGRDGGRGGGGEGSNELFALILMPLYSIKHPSEALNRTLTHSLSHTQSERAVCVCVMHSSPEPPSKNFTGAFLKVALSRTRWQENT